MVQACEDKNNTKWVEYEINSHIWNFFIYLTTFTIDGKYLVEHWAKMHQFKVYAIWKVEFGWYCIADDSCVKIGSFS